MLRQIGQQQKRARIEIGGDQDQRRVGRAAHAGGQGSALLSAPQLPADSRRIAVRLGFTHPASEPHRRGCVKLRRREKASAETPCVGKRSRLLGICRGHRAGRLSKLAAVGLALPDSVIFYTYGERLTYHLNWPLRRILGD